MTGEERNAASSSSSLPSSGGEHAEEIALDPFLQFMEVAVGAARLAGQVIADNFHKPKQVEHKGQVDLVTATDKQCEELIRRYLLDSFPSHQFLGEEESFGAQPAELSDVPTWIVDPVDGTTNFVHSFPFVCVSIGLCIDKQPVLGVVFNPILDEMYTAVEGRGAQLNGKPIRCSSQSEMKKALLATEIGTTRDDATLTQTTERIKHLLTEVRSLRCCGSCAMNLVGVASGRLDLFYEVNFGGAWDVAAGVVIVREAGGHIFDPSGGEFDIMKRTVAASNGNLKASFLKALNP